MIFKDGLFVDEQKSVCFTYGQVEGLLAHINNIANDKRVAFQARLKHLQRNKFPKGINTGKGKPAVYSFQHVLQMVLAIEYIQSGMSPLAASKLVKGSWGSIQITAYLSSFSAVERSEMNDDDQAEDYLWVVYPEALRTLSEEGEEEYDHMEAISPVPISSWAYWVGEGGSPSILGSPWRALVINAGVLVRSAMAAIAFHFKWATFSEMRQSFVNDMDKEKEEIERISAKLGTFEANPKKVMKAAEFNEVLKGDYTANPPIPATRLKELATDLIKLLPPAVYLYLSGDNDGLAGDDINFMVSFGMAERDGIGFRWTPLGDMTKSLLSPPDKTNDRNS